MAKTPRKSATKTAPRTRAKAPGAEAGGAAERSVMASVCRELPGTTFDVKWETNFCACVAGKIYCGTETSEPGLVGFKCDDIDFEKLTRRKGIIPAPYAARFGWVKLTEPGALTTAELTRYIRKSYALVVEKLPKKVREGLTGR